MIKVGVLYGGRSEEHDVSKCSAASVVSAIDRSKYDIVAIGIDRVGRWFVQDEPAIIESREFGKVMDLRKKGRWLLNHFEDGNRLSLFDIESGKKVTVDMVFPVIHGTFCEDGTLQGLLELCMVPFVGAGTAGSVLGMDKDLMKRILRDSGVLVTEWETLHISDWKGNQENIIKNVLENLKLPLFVKPSSSGSSVGISKVKNPRELSAAIHHAFTYDNKVLVERGVDAREIECSVMGNNTPRASVLGEIIPNHEFYSYEAKYLDTKGADLVIPAGLDGAVSETVRELAVKIYKILNCSGMARIDFFLDRESGNIYLNEINTIPGFTSISMYPKLWEHTGLGYKDLITSLIDLGFERFHDQKRIRST